MPNACSGKKRKRGIDPKINPEYTTEFTTYGPKCPATCHSKSPKLMSWASLDPCAWLDHLKDILNTIYYIH